MTTAPDVHDRGPLNPVDVTFLAEAGAALAHGTSLATIAARIAALAVPRLADFAIVLSPSVTPELEPMMVAHREPSRADVLRADLSAETLAALIERHTAPRFIRSLEKATDRSPELAALGRVGARALAIVPLAVQGGTAGLVLARTTEAPIDEAIAALYGTVAGVALGTACSFARRLYRQKLEHGRILDAVPALIWFKDRDNRILRCNRAAAQTASVTVAEMEGRPTETFYPDEAAKYRADDLEVMQTGEPKLGIVEPYQLGTDEKIWIRTDKLPYRDSTGEITGVLVFSVDITRLKRAEEERAELLDRARIAQREAEQANRSKDEFLTTLSHELRTPLTAVIGWAQLLSRKQQLNETERARALDAILRNAKAQARLIDDILDVSRFISGKLSLKLQRVDLGEVVRAALEALRPTALAKGVVLDARCESVRLLGDLDRLHQVVWNLVANAVKFTPRGGRVEVRVDEERGGARIVVRDNGPGIEPEFLPYVFERFRQADASSSRRHGGLGIGLAVVRQFAELHGGTVRAESAGAGQGATFTVELPRSEAALEPLGEAALAAGGRALQGLRVLVADDDLDARQILSAILTDVGAQVVTASSTNNALDALCSAQPHVLVSDIGMPGRDGHDLIRAVRTLEETSGHHLPAIALTAYASPSDGQRALDSGFQCHLCKPIEPDLLIATVARLALPRA